jgi:hypothetical protein
MGERPAAAVKKEKKPWGDKKRTGNNYLLFDAPFLAALCTTTQSSFYVPGRLSGASIPTNPISSTYKQVEVLLDTGAVMGNYCSRRVGEWVRKHHPQCWERCEEGEEVA